MQTPSNLEEWWLLIAARAPGPIPCALIMLGVTVAVAYFKPRLVQKPTSVSDTVPASSTTVANTKSNKDRKFGEWTPVDFAYPDLSAQTVELSEIKPVPYRPFRWGEYHVTMGIRAMPWDEWIELDNQFEKYHRIRSRRIRTRGDGVIRVLPDNPGVVSSAKEAAIELVHELAEYLSRRHPTMFHVTRHSEHSSQSHGWDGAPAIKTIKIVSLNITYDIPLTAHEPGSAERAMEIAALITQEDLALMIEGTDGKYYFQAGAICVPGFWRMSEKIGMPLEQIHTSGKVPQYKEKLHMSMERYFQRLSVEKPVVRNNYFFQVIKPKGNTSEPTNDTAEDTEEEIDPDELGWSVTTAGPEDKPTHADPAHPLPRPTPTPANLRLRSERQTVRRLPRTGAIAFTIRTYLTPIEDLGKEPGIPGRLASALRGWGSDVGTYKGKERGGWWDMLLEYLDKRSAEQVLNGECEEGVLKHGYPF